MAIKEQPKTLTPKLRFPEFKDEPVWELRALSSALDYERPENYIVASTAYQPSGTPVLTANKSFVLGYTNETDGVYSDVPVIIFDDFTTDRKYVDFPFKVKSSAIKILKRKSDDDLKLIFELMGGIRFDPKEHKRYYISEYQHLEIPLPGEAEQRKIAACLTSLDELLTAEGRKLEALRTHKKGLMQQLFPREGETRPRLRFPEFRDAPEWKEKKLDELAKRRTGHTPNKAKPEYYNGGVKWVSLADSKRLDKGLIHDTSVEISLEGIENSSAVLHPAGSVILSRDAGVGKSAVTAHPMAVSQHFIVWICVNEKLSNWFLYFVLQRLKPLFEQIATGSTIKTIGMPFFNAMRIVVPSLAEQQRIAACLSSLDALITVQSRKLDSLRTHKKGLMQQLFPSANGV